MEKFTMIINHRNSSQDRYINLMTVVKYYRQYYLNNIDIIIVEQDNTQKVKLNQTKHIFIHNNGLFNRSWGFNVGLLNATTDKIIFNDNDILLNYNDLDLALNSLNEYDTVNPYKSIVDLNSNITNDVIQTLKLPNLNNNGRGGINYSGGMLLVNKNSFLNIGAWDEDMRGWGGEDDLMTHKIFNMLTFIEHDTIAYHLYHTRFNTDTHAHTHYHNNLEVLSKIRNMNKHQLFDYYKDKQIGNINKYV